MARRDPNALLRTLYAKSALAKAVLDHFADRQKNANEMSVDSMIAILERQGLAASRSAVVEIFRDLEEAETGRFLVGRKQHPSRFVWSEESCSVGRRARQDPKGSGEATHTPEIARSSQARRSADLITHPFLLRPDVQISLALPPDLTQNEASRIAEFVKTLPFER